MSDLYVIIKDINDTRGPAVCQQRATVWGLMERSLKGGNSVCSLDEAIMPEIAKELINKGYDVNVYIVSDGAGRTVISWMMPREKGQCGNLNVDGPDEIRINYTKIVYSDSSNAQQAATQEQRSVD